MRRVERCGTLCLEDTLWRINHELRQYRLEYHELGTEYGTERCKETDADVDCSLMKNQRSKVNRKMKPSNDVDERPC